MHRFFRFIYLNTYSFLLLICGIVIILIPFYKVSVWFYIPQGIACFIFVKQAIKLFSTWKDKKIKYQILMEKNKKEFRPESFKIFMQAPCGRLLTKAVLKDLGIKNKYKELLIYKEPLFLFLKKNCQKTETKIYVNEDFK